MSKVTTDPIADMLSRIRNAIAVRKNEVRLPYSKIKRAVADILAANNYVDAVKEDGEGIEKQIIITINQEFQNARITEIKRLSTPGRRMYTSSDKIPVLKRGRGVIVVSTSKGLMTGIQAKKERLGGELLCSIY